MFYSWGVELINLAFSGYLISSLLYLVVTWINREPIGRLAYWTAAVSFATHTTALTFRAVAAGRLPFATMHEFILMFAWGVILTYLFVQARFKIPLLGLLVVPMAVLLLGYAAAMNQEIRPLMPALQSYWLQLHVLVAIVAYGAFGVSFGTAVVYLIKNNSGSGLDYLPAKEVLERVMYKSIAIGFPFMTLVLITGAVWAEEVWGRWWSWDPKETWALITWIIYAIYLHARFVRGWQGAKAAWMAVIGFGAVLFTLFGVTILMSGLHSYS